MVLNTKNTIYYTVFQPTVGLGNSVWTGDKEKALFFAENLESGTVSINQITKSDVRLPFGGTKNSGYGTELSLYALHEFVSKKTIIGNL